MVTVLKLFKIEVEKISLVVFRAKKPKISYLRKQNELWDIQYIKIGALFALSSLKTQSEQLNHYFYEKKFEIIFIRMLPCEADKKNTYSNNFLKCW